MQAIVIAIRVTLVTAAVTGLAYPLLVTGAAQLLFPRRANGSWVEDDAGRIVGSELLAQRFTRDGYFQPRPSAAGSGYDASASGGSNAGPTQLKLQQRMRGELERLRRENPEASSSVPAELLTASASGLDPHLSPEAARWQLARVARARGVSSGRIETLIDSLTETPDWGLLGEPCVNVLLLNLAMDRRFGRLHPPPAR